MTPDWIEIVQYLQHHYVVQYQEWVGEQALGVESSSPEVAFLLADDTPIIRHQYRVDFAINNTEGGEVHEFQPDRRLNFPTWTGQRGSAALVVEPFVWSAAVVSIEGAQWDEVSVTPWFDDWFGMSSGREAAAPPGGLGGMIHSAAIDGPDLYIDLGSAPAEALVQLVDIAARNGASRITVHNEFETQEGEAAQ